jgi:hypothetical protein
VLSLAACGHPEAAPAPAVAAAPACPTDPVALSDGLTAARIAIAGTPATAGQACLDVVRGDLAKLRLRVLTAARDGNSHPAPVWRETFHLAAVINAGMFHADGAPVGLIVENDVAVGADNKSFAGVLAFDPKSDKDPPAIVTGRKCPGFDLADLRRRYHSLVQSSRLLGCDGEALPWADPKQYSAAAIGVDRSGRIVMMHTRAALTMTELSRALAALDLTGALFLEGGPEASLVVKGSAGEVSVVGSYETGFVDNDRNHEFWWLPNVIALEPR